MESVLNAIFRCIIAMAANAARAPGRIASANRPVVIVPVALPHRRTLPKIHNGQYQFRIGHATGMQRRDAYVHLVLHAASARAGLLGP